MTSIFSKIVAGEVPSYKIAENNEFYAFLDINPVVKGHTLVIPKKETDYIFDIDDEALGRMMIFSKTIAKAIKKTIPCTRVGVAVVGLEIPHAHIHLMPIDKESDMFFGNPKLRFTPDELKSIAENIKTNLI
ncbi:MAG: HIT family protein [Tannerella sp.]|jgi:histidine triad (HIT) family protein|nr:HIT family protein [Tannerella sp.]